MKSRALASLSLPLPSGTKGACPRKPSSLNWRMRNSWNMRSRRLVSLYREFSIAILKVLVDLDYRHSVLEQNRVAAEMRQWHDEQLPVSPRQLHQYTYLWVVDVSRGSSAASRGHQYCSPSNSWNPQVCMILGYFTLNINRILQQSLPHFGQIMLSHPAGDFGVLLCTIHRRSTSGSTWWIFASLPHLCHLFQFCSWWTALYWILWDWQGTWLRLGAVDQ